MRKIINQDNGKIEIIGNGHEKPLLHWFELTEKEKQEFDYDGMEEDSFFRYKNWIHTLSDIMRIDKNMPEFMQAFDGYSPDSFFSGILVKLTEDSDYIKVYTYIS